MSLSWTTRVRQQIADAQGQSPLDESPIERVLFVGFGEVPGFHAVDWQDRAWLNAADFDAVLLNCRTLSDLLSRCQIQYGANPEGFSTKWYDRLHENLAVLREQILDVINSGRSVFALATPRVEWSVGGGVFKSSVDTYSWCPLPITAYEESGEVSVEIDPRFEPYREHLGRWECHFDDKPRTIDLKGRGGLQRGQKHILVPHSLFRNLSYHPLGIELRYGVVSRSGGEDKLEAVSGPIYVLHHPSGGDLWQAVRALLREFFGQDIPEPQAPEWVHTIPLPGDSELQARILEISNQIDALVAQQRVLAERRRQLEHWRGLLYKAQQGLRDVALDALELLGLENGRPVDHDGTAFAGQYGDKMLLVRVVGTAETATRREVFDLDSHIQGFEQDQPEAHVDKGVLIVNAWRGAAPETRGRQGRAVLSADAIEHATLLDFALLDSRLLYRWVTEAIEGRMEDVGVALTRLLNTAGVCE
jgi:hypothetical protein